MKHVVGFNSSDLGDCGEDVSTVDRCSLQTVAMIDLPLTRLLVNVELHTQTHTHREGHYTKGGNYFKYSNV